MAIRSLTEQRALEIVRKIPSRHDFKAYYLSNPAAAVQLVAFAMASRLDMDKQSWAFVAHNYISESGTAHKAIQDCIQGFKFELIHPHTTQRRAQDIKRTLEEMQLQLLHLDALLGYGE